MLFRVCIKIERDGEGFHAYSPGLPGLHVCGESEQDAFEHAKDAAAAYIESMLKHGDPLPIACSVAKHRQPDWHMANLELAVVP